MKKRLLSIFLAALMIVTILPETAMAKGLDARDVVNEGETFVWDVSEKTLTLTNYVNESMTDDPAINLLPDISKIVLVGTNKIKTSGTVGIMCAGSLLIEGTGSLEITAENKTEYSGYTSGIHVGGDLTIAGATVIATGGEGKEKSKAYYLHSYGIYAAGTIEIKENAKVTAISQQVSKENSASIALRGTTISISNATVDATAARARSTSAGIYAKDTITITNSNVEADSDDGKTSCGICVTETGSVTITNSHVIASADDDVSDRHAVLASVTLSYPNGYEYRFGDEEDDKPVPFTSSSAKEYSNTSTPNASTSNYFEVKPASQPMGTYTVTYRQAANTNMAGNVVHSGLATGDAIPAAPTDITANNGYELGTWTLKEGTVGEAGKIGTTDLVYELAVNAVYELTYDINGGNTAVPTDSNKYLSSHTATLKTVWVADETKPGHAAEEEKDVVFIGWSATKISKTYSKDDTITAGTLVESVTFDASNITVYAVWGYDTNKNGTADVQEPKYTVTYRAAAHTSLTTDRVHSGLLTGDAIPDAPSVTADAGYTPGTWALPSGTEGANRTVGTADLEYTLTVTANSDTPYEVEHYQADLDGNYPTDPCETENKSGTTDTTATAVAKTYPGFTENTSAADRVTSGTITGDGTLVLKLYYKRNTYTVTFVDEDGTTEFGKQSYPYGTPAATVQTYANTLNPTKEADVEHTYTFEKWNPSITEVTGDITYEAVYKTDTRKYNLTYDANGGYGTETPTNYTVVDQAPYGNNHALRTASPFSHVGTTDTPSIPIVWFGWSETNNGEKVYSKTDECPTIATTVNITGKKTVYALWGLDTNNNGTADVLETKYTVTYRQAANTDMTGAVVHRDLVTGDTIPAASAVKANTGFALGEWKLISGSPVDGKIGTTDLVYELEVNAVYKLTYDGNGGKPETIPADTIQYKSGDTANLVVTGELPQHDPEGNDAVVFIGWNTTEYTTICTKEDKDTLPDRLSTVKFANADITVYALWGLDTNDNGKADVLETQYTVTYTDGVDGETVFADQVTTGLLAGNATPAFNGTPSRKGYTFQGWKPEVAETVTGSVTYVAQWEKNRVWFPTFVVGGPTITVEGLNMEDHVAYVVGRGNHCFVPYGTVTRAEAATMYFRLLTEDFRNYYWDDDASYSDVKSSDWFHVAVATLEAAGVIQDTPAYGKFRPNEPITRAEMAVMAAQFCKVSGKVADSSFRDVSSSYWAADEIAVVECAGFIQGFNGYYRPDDTITRAECVTIINRMLERGAEAENMLPGMVTFTDVTADAWYYEAVQEAANSHTYDRSGFLMTNERFCGEFWRTLEKTPDGAALEQLWAVNR